jgi:hypothetical protein
LPDPIVEHFLNRIGHMGFNIFPDRVRTYVAVVEKPSLSVYFDLDGEHGPYHVAHAVSPIMLICLRRSERSGCFGFLKHPALDGVGHVRGCVIVRPNQVCQFFGLVGKPNE